MKLTLTFHSDPGHGWLQVPVSVYKNSGVSASRFSYRDKTSVYLEEDCDAGKFIQAMKQNGYEIEITEKNHKYDAFIRNLPSIGD